LAESVTESMTDFFFVIDLVTDSGQIFSITDSDRIFQSLISVTIQQFSSSAFVLYLLRSL